MGTVNSPVVVEIKKTPAHAIVYANHDRVKEDGRNHGARRLMDGSWPGDPHDIAGLGDVTGRSWPGHVHTR